MRTMTYNNLCKLQERTETRLILATLRQFLLVFWNLVLS